MARRSYNISPRSTQAHAKAPRRSLSTAKETVMVTKTVRCDCGFIVRSDNDDKLVADLQRHALDDHKMNLTRDQVLAMAQPEPDAQTPNGKT
jgi:predicted small metal-binding protein